MRPVYNFSVKICWMDVVVFVVWAICLGLFYLLLSVCVLDISLCVLVACLSNFEYNIYIYLEFY